MPEDYNLGITPSVFSDKEYERLANRFRSHRERARNPAGYERFQMMTYARKAAAEAVAAAAQQEKETDDTAQDAEVHVDDQPDDRPTFEPTVLDTGASSNPALFINRFGGNKETMAHSGLKAVKAAEAAGLSIRQIQQMANAQGVQFGHRAVDYINEQLGPSAEDTFASQISAMQQMFQQSMQQQMQQAMVAQQTRPEVAGVKMAEGTGGTPMQIARRGVTGAFGRRGMRISALNV